MDLEQVALKLQETTDRSVRNEGRIKKLESEHEVLHQLPPPWRFSRADEDPERAA